MSILAGKEKRVGRRLEGSKGDGVFNKRKGGNRSIEPGDKKPRRQRIKKPSLDKVGKLKS